MGQDHLLVIPKRHVVSFFNLSAQEDKDIAALVKIGTQILKKLKLSKDLPQVCMEAKQWRV